MVFGFLQKERMLQVMIDESQKNVNGVVKLKSTKVM